MPNKVKDPRQQQLRETKHKWSESASELISKIIAFKRGLNGRGDPAYNLPISNIKDPLPSEIGTFLNQLTSEFNQVVSGAEGIISQQAGYSQSRRKKMPKKQPSAQPVAKDPTVEALSRIGGSSSDLLTKEGSNRLTRIWSYMSNIFSGKKYNSQRLGLLRHSSDLYYALLDFENQTLSAQKSNIPKVISNYRKVKNDIDIISEMFDGVLKLVAREAGVSKDQKIEDDEPVVGAPIENKPAPKQETKPEVSGKKPSKNDDVYDLDAEEDSDGQVQPEMSSEIAAIRNAVHLLWNAGIEKQQMTQLGALVNQYDEEEDLNMKSLLKDRITDNYEKLIKSVGNQVQKKYGPIQINNINDIINVVRKNSSDTFSGLIVKNAHNGLSRFLKKQLIKAIPFNETASIRLEIVDSISELKILVSKLMDLLEKGLSLEEIKVIVNEIKKTFEFVKMPLHTLSLIGMRDYNPTMPKGKNNKEVDFGENNLDYVMRRKLRRDLSQDLF